MHICYIFLRDILLFVVEDVKGSLPNYIKALTSDSALNHEVLPVLVLGGIFLVMLVISGVFITLTPCADGSHPAVGSNHHGYS